MTSSKQIDKLLAEESAQWTEVLQRDEGRVPEGFAAWSRKSPMHIRHFLMMVALDQELVRVDPERRMSVPRLSREATNVIPLSERASEPKAPYSRTLHWWSLAAVLLVAVTALLAIPYLQRDTGWQEYVTARGEQRAVELPDGSIVQLNTQSRLAARMLAGERQVRLLEGEALFKVHHDTSRPFRVYTSDAVIQAVGTQFNVYRQSDGTKVSVLEGRVRVAHDIEALLVPVAVDSRNVTGASARIDDVERSSPSAEGTAQPDSGGVTYNSTQLLAAGEEAKVASDGHINRSENVDPASIAAWRHRRLVFKQDTLQDVVTEFNRYNRSPQFRLVGASVIARRYSGAFDADDPESLMALLRVDPQLLIEVSGDEIIVRERNQTGTLVQKR